jgi:hypothetical protein
VALSSLFQMFPDFALASAATVVFSARSSWVNGISEIPVFGQHSFQMRVLLTFGLEIPHVEVTS